MVEPYCSPVSNFFYRRFHHERTDLQAEPFAPDASTAAAPLESNQARPTLVFYRHRIELGRRWPDLALFEEQRFAFVTYPLTGGFSRRPLVPASLYRPLRLLERGLRPLGLSSPFVASSCSSDARSLAARYGTTRNFQNPNAAIRAQDEAVAEAADVRRAVGPRLVADGHVDDLQGVTRRARARGRSRRTDRSRRSRPASGAIGS